MPSRRVTAVVHLGHEAALAPQKDFAKHYQHTTKIRCSILGMIFLGYHPAAIFRYSYRYAEYGQSAAHSDTCG